MHQIDAILEQQIKPCVGKQLFCLILFFQKALCQIAGHEDEAGHMEKVDKGPYADGEGGIHILQVAEEMPAYHKENENALDIIHMVIPRIL